MFNRTAIMRSAWAEYRRQNRTAPFDRAAFAAILRQRWTAARLLCNRAGIMAAAWASYRRTAAQAGYDRFNRRLFGRVLRMAWINARAEQDSADHARRAAKAGRTVVVLSPRAIELNAALDAVKYLPSHMSAARAEAAIRARLAAHA